MQHRTAGKAWHATIPRHPAKPPPITNRLLYQLSYVGSASILNGGGGSVKGRGAMENIRPSSRLHRRSLEASQVQRTLLGPDGGRPSRHHQSPQSVTPREQEIAPDSDCADASYFSLILDVGLGWQQDPERVNAEGGTEGDVEEERNKREYDSERARPRFSLQQTPTHDKSRKSFYDHDRCNKAQEGMQERG